MGLRLGVPSDRHANEARIDEELSRLITQLTNEINWNMRERGLTRADLASRMGVSPGRVSQVLSGGENLTLRTLAALSTALDAQFDVQLTSGEPAVDGDQAHARPGLEHSATDSHHEFQPLGGFEDASASRFRQ
jgi:transcriptional regulator with XRE-family HTH domain